MVKLKGRMSEGDISLFLSRSRRGHKPLLETRSLPVRPNRAPDTAEPVAKIVKDTIGQIAESEKEVEWAAREMEYIIRKERRAIEDFEKKTGGEGKSRGMGVLTSWMNLKRETDKNHQAAKEDMKRASVAMKAAEDKISSIEDRLEEEERQLQIRARALRRKSEDIFKFVDHHRIMVSRAESARVTSEGDVRYCEVTSL
ncbi:uncharacterized protein LOC111708278 [Eurytemora carolleeae]|uniref:uncharacterized protein LOC111708278 n=1 Tax=Eurytemora carolleeae TaxID=1294199 RepID=UPI000C77FBE8|nr:uncharacterized protein LOC111708278 [Eurytemora carolleeae]|eukprot:XP_023337365.1 uncharacterized protein LOC111708278 [Eurytemora affinis]